MNTQYDLLLRALTDHFGSRLKTVVLFGSQAREEASPSSDYDFFIVAEEMSERPLERVKHVRSALIPYLPDLPGSVNLHAKTPREFEADLTPLYLEVCVDGICLYGRDYFEPLRQKALAALAASGMQRKRAGKNLFWMFPEGKPKNWELTWEGYRERP